MKTGPLPGNGPVPLVSYPALLSHPSRTGGLASAGSPSLESFAQGGSVGRGAVGGLTSLGLTLSPSPWPCSRASTRVSREQTPRKTLASADAEKVTLSSGGVVT